MWNRPKWGRRPAARVLMVLCLGLGLGGATGVWAVFEAVLVRPLPYRDGERLVMVWSTLPGTDAERADVASAPVNVERLAERQRVFEGLAWWRTAGFDLTGEGEPARLTGVRAAPGLFPLLGVSALRGRLLGPEDGADGAVAVLSEGAWRRRFGGRDEVIGRTIRLDGRPYRVVGVVAGAVALPPAAEVWVPLELEDRDDPVARVSDLTVVGRLRGSVGLEAAAADLDRVAAELAAEDPALNGNRGLRLEGLSTSYARRAAGPLRALMAGVALMLVMACVNAANLSVVRLREDARDVLVRRALGASRGRVVAAGLVSGLGAGAAALVLGLGVAALLVPRFVALAGIRTPGGPPVVLDARVLGFAVGCALLASLAAGLAPALAARRVDVAGALRAGGRGVVADRSGRRLRDGLVVAQVAVGLVLLLGALGAMVRVRDLLATDPGFRVEDTVTLRVAANPARHGGLEAKLAFYDGLLDALRAIPGVAAAGATNLLPVGDPDAYWSFSVEDRPPADPTIPEVARGRLVLPGYFEALGIPLLAGRDIARTDRIEGAPVVVVSRRLADRYWPGGRAVGRRIKRRTWDSPYPWMTVVGVVDDVRDDGLAEPAAATVYFPLAQVDTRFSDAATFVLRLDGPPTVVLPEVRRRLHALDAEAPIERLATMEQLLAESVSPERFASALVTGFAALGLLLLVTGVYGLLALAVAERRSEIAVRLALGATPRRVLSAVVGAGMARVGMGMVLGLAGGLAMRPVDAGPLLGGAAVSAGVVAAVLAIIAVAGLLASALPALRAARVDPARSMQI